MPTMMLPEILIQVFLTQVVEPVDHALAGGKPHSPEYRNGMLDVYALHALRNAMPRLRYVVGTAQADAYYAGVAAGHALWHQQQGATNQPSTSSLHNQEHQP